MDDRTQVTVALLIGLVFALGYGAMQMLWTAGDERAPEYDGSDLGPAGADEPDRRGSDVPAANLTDVGSGDVPTDVRYAAPYRRGAAPIWVRESDVPLEEWGRQGPQHVETVEVTRYPTVDPTPAQLDAAWRLYNASYEAARERGFFRYENADADGYRIHDPVHHLNPEYYLDDETLAPRDPEALVYVRNYTNGTYSVSGSRDRVLAGYMYMAPGLAEEGPQTGGPLTVWHYHPQSWEECFAARLNVGVEFDGYDCGEDDVRMHRSPEMMHVWFVRRPGGPFATGMPGAEEAARMYRSLNGTSDGLPEKMNESTFKAYARRTHAR